MSWESLFLPNAINKGADQPALPRSLVSTFVDRCLDSMIHMIAISKIPRPWLVSVAEQAGLKLTKSQPTEDRVSRDVAQFILKSHFMGR